MRLIDADELKKALKSNCTPELCHDINTAWCDGCCRTNDFEDLIDNAPTIEPFEKIGAICNENCGMTRPQGEWEYDPPHDYARRFGKWQYMSGGYYKCNKCPCYSLHKTNYCSNCGADMRQEESE